MQGCLKLLAEITSFTLAFNTFLQAQGPVQIGPGSSGIGEAADLLSAKFLGDSSIKAENPKMPVAFSGNIGFTFADFIYSWANGMAIGESKGAINRMPSLVNLSLQQTAAASAIVAGNPGTIGSTIYDPANSTYFAEYDVFEIDFQSAGTPCIAGLGG
jgi:hypothetical protein